MIAALASVIDSQDPQEIDEILDEIPDPIGTFYRFSMSKAVLAGATGGSNGDRDAVREDS